MISKKTQHNPLLHLCSLLNPRRVQQKRPAKRSVLDRLSPIVEKIAFNALAKGKPEQGNGRIRTAAKRTGNRHGLNITLGPTQRPRNKQIDSSPKTQKRTQALRKRHFCLRPTPRAEFFLSYDRAATTAALHLGDVAELADALDLGSSTARCAGSTPVIPIKNFSSSIIPVFSGVRALEI